MHPGPLPLIQHRLPWKVRVCAVKEGRVFGIFYKVVSVVYFIENQFVVFCCIHFPDVYM